MKLENEKALIRTIAEGNTKSFEVLFYSYYPRLKGFICDLLQSPEEAEDISQDIFTTLWQNRTSLDKIDNISAYLFRIAKNAVYRHIERNMLFKNYQQKQTESTPNVIEDNEIYKYIDAKELELLITIAVERMPPQRQRIYRLHPPPIFTAIFSIIRIPGVVLRVSRTRVLVPSNFFTYLWVIVAMPLIRCMMFSIKRSV